MSTYYHVDSRWRDRNEYPNPSDFCIPLNVSKGWRTENRTVDAVRPHNKMQATNFVHTVKLEHMTLPYDFGGSVGTSHLDIYPFIYVAFQSTTECKDSKLINTQENGNTVNKTLDASGNLVVSSLKDAVFVAYCDKVQQNSWVQYKSNMTQTYRIKLDDTLHVRFFGPDGKNLNIVDNAPPNNINPLRQINALFEVTPYVRDAEYDNHFTPLYDSMA